MTTNDYHDLIFSYFNYYIVAMVCEYLNDIKQHSYDDLTDDWWLTLFNEINIIDKLVDCDTSEEEILNRVLAKFPNDFLTGEQINEMRKYLKEAYTEFVLSALYPVH